MPVRRSATALGGTGGGHRGAVWGGLIRIFAYQHATLSVNSICHMFGRRELSLARREPQQLARRAALAFGEGWHNNHHAFPASARARPRSFPARHRLAHDPRLEKLGLAWNVKLPDLTSQTRRRAGRRRGLKRCRTGVALVLGSVLLARPARRPSRCARHESNVRPQPPQGCALSPELRAPCSHSTSVPGPQRALPGPRARSARRRPRPPGARSRAPPRRLPAGLRCS